MDLNWKTFELTCISGTNDSTLEMIGILTFKKQNNCVREW